MSSENLFLEFLKIWLTIKADFASAVDKGKGLKEHISERTVICRPTTHLAIRIGLTGCQWFLDHIRCTRIRPSIVCLARKLMKLKRNLIKRQRRQGWIKVFVTEILCWYIIYSTTQWKPIPSSWELDGFVEHWSLEFCCTENQPCHPKMMKRFLARKGKTNLEIWILDLRIDDEC